jgi:hypothetical protein
MQNNWNVKQLEEKYTCITPNKGKRVIDRGSVKNHRNAPSTRGGCQGQGLVFYAKCEYMTKTVSLTRGVYDKGRLSKTQKKDRKKALSPSVSIVSPPYINIKKTIFFKKIVLWTCSQGPVCTARIPRNQRHSPLQCSTDKIEKGECCTPGHRVQALHPLRAILSDVVPAGPPREEWLARGGVRGTQKQKKYVVVPYLLTCWGMLCINLTFE